MMRGEDETYPGYGFARNKGYPTREHFAGLTALGPCPLHRRSFKPVWERLDPAQFSLSLDVEIQDEAQLAPAFGCSIFCSSIAAMASGAAHIPFPICARPLSPHSRPMSTFHCS